MSSVGAFCRQTAGRQAASDHRWLILVIVAIAQLNVVLDATIVNIALPSAQHALGFTNGDRQSIVTAYSLAFGSLLLLGGRLAGLIWARRSSSAWPRSRSPPPLGAPPALRGACFARALQGLFGALSRRPPWAPWSAPSATRASAAGRSASSDPSRRRRGGGPDPRRLPDRVLLLALVPVRQPVLRRDRHGRRPGLHADRPAGHPPADGLGRNRALLGRAVPLVFGFSHAALAGWTAALTIGSLVAGVVLLTAFAFAERRVTTRCCRCG